MAGHVLDAITEYLNSLTQVPDSLKLASKNLKALGPLPIRGRAITTAILVTLKTYYRVQDEIKMFLNKRYRSAAADFFVETLLFYLKAFIETHNLGLEAVSEKQVRPSRGSLRPDITVWRADHLIAVIECKTNLGWNRDGWERDFTRREAKIHSDFPDAKCFLVVATEINWAGFGDDPKVGDQYFALSKVWPSDVDSERIEAQIQNPVEPMLHQIKALASKSVP